MCRKKVSKSETKKEGRFSSCVYGAFNISDEGNLTLKACQNLIPLPLNIFCQSKCPALLVLSKVCTMIVKSETLC